MKLVLVLTALFGVVSMVTGACSWVRARRGTRVVSHDNVWCAAVPPTGRILMRIPPRNAGTWLNYQYEQEDGEFTMTLTHGTNNFAGEGDNMAQAKAWALCAAKKHFWGAAYNYQSNCDNTPFGAQRFATNNCQAPPDDNWNFLSSQK